jgi:hypothetical protein
VDSSDESDGDRSTSAGDRITSLSLSSRDRNRLAVENLSAAENVPADRKSVPRSRKIGRRIGPLPPSSRRKLRELVSHAIPLIHRYSPLKGDEIRLVVLQSGVPGSPLACILATIHAQENREYDVVSCMWGPDDPSNPVSILTSSYKSGRPPSFTDFNHSKIYIRNNLHCALQQLRHPDKDVTLWVDALCINQEDRDEKALQVSMMMEIYTRAANVIVWLGLPTRTSDVAFKFIPEVLDLNGLDELIKDPSKFHCWECLADLMKNPMFGRSWLIRELAMARNAVLRCGSSSIEWEKFSNAVGLFETKFYDIQRYASSSWVGERFEDIRALGGCQLVKLAGNILRKSPDGKILNRLEDLETLVSTLVAFEVSDPRDTIYGLLGLAKDKPPLIPDPKMSVLDVFTTFVKYCTESSGNIDIICRHWAPESPLTKTLSDERPKKVELPSWISRVTNSAFGRPREHAGGRFNGDSFVGLPNRRIYNAALGFPPLDVGFGRTGAHLFSDSTYNGTMHVLGLQLGVIGELSSRNAHGVILGESLEMGGWKTDSRHVPDRLWRTLVADRGPDNTSPPSWYQTACLHTLWQSYCGDLMTTETLKDPNCSQVIAEFLRRVQSVVWNRKFLLSTEVINGDRLFGLAPAATKLGDSICILYGCSVPVILRNHVTPNDHYFELIGESFIYGMMDGEAFETFKDSRREIFEIR